MYLIYFLSRLYSVCLQKIKRILSRLYSLCFFHSRKRTELLDLPDELLILILQNLSLGRQLGINRASHRTNAVSEAALKLYRELHPEAQCAIERTDGIVEGPQIFLPINKHTIFHYRHIANALDYMHIGDFYWALQATEAAIRKGVPLLAVADIQKKCCWRYGREFLRCGSLLQSNHFRNRAIHIAQYQGVLPPRNQDIPYEEWEIGIIGGMNQVRRDVCLGNFMDAETRYGDVLATAKEVAAPIPNVITLGDWEIGVRTAVVQGWPNAEEKLTKALSFARETDASTEVDQIIHEGLRRTSLKGGHRRFRHRAAPMRTRLINR